MTRLYMLLCCAMISTLISAQCVSTFPYVQDFETSNGGWTAGGTGNDWAWGSPAKTVITGASSGSKCWVTGGLTTSFYNYGEDSYVTSPCFNFTNLQHPYIQFLIFWESEWKYDGTNLQYSLNGDTTWTNIGAYGDAVNCLNANWYNETSVKYLQGIANPLSGWCGNVQATAGSCQGGHGSGGWVTAKHCLSELAGQSNVRFRFTFGAGTTCNDFDGVAFDSVAIGDAALNGGTFTYACTNANTVSFAGSPTMCPDTILWNFNDVASGGSNTASTLSSSHVFSAPGIYNVSLTLSGPCNAPITINKSLSILGVTATPTNAGCSSATGSISVSVTGGAGNYTYTWSGGLSGQNPTGVNPGPYVVTVTAAQTCPATASATISNTGGVVTAHATTTNVTCGGNNGSITMSVTGGASPYSFNWSGGLIGQNPTSVSAGTYTVTVTDNAGCSTTATATVGGTGSPNISVSATNTSCGLNNGSASVNVISGTGPYTYAWSNSNNTFNVSSLAPGTYTVTVSGGGGCTTTANATISSSTGLIVTTSSTAAGCTSSGTASANATGGSGTYTYFWSTGSTLQTAPGLSSGNYNVTVSSSGCSATASATVGASGGGISYTSATTPASCGAANGSASVTVTAGTGPFTYAWNTTGTSSSISNLAGGTSYSVTIDGSGGCSATASINVAAVGGLTLSTTPSATTCGLNNGSATVAVTAGPGPYNYSWSGGGSGSTVNNLASGSYSVTTTGSGGCSGTATVNIAPSTGVTINLTSTNTTCGASNGSATVSVNIGSSPYTYNWSNGSSTDTASNLASGASTVTVHDAAGCSATASIAVGPSTRPTVTTTANKTIMCTGDSAELCAQPSGFSSYQWNTASTGSCISVGIAGAYNVTVVDNSGCSASSSPVQITNYQPTPVTISVNGDTLSSYNAVSYQWFFNGMAIPGDTTQVIVAQQTGDYTVRITDNNGCHYNSTPTSVTALGIESIGIDGQLTVYPNPLSGDNWHIEAGTGWLGAVIEIFDVNGQVVYRSQLINATHEIPLHVANGLYVLRVSTGVKSACLKLIKL